MYFFIKKKLKSFFLSLRIYEKGHLETEWRRAKISKINKNTYRIKRERKSYDWKKIRQIKRFLNIKLK